MRYALEINEHRVEAESMAECFMRLQQVVLRDGVDEEVQSVLDNLRTMQDVALESKIAGINFRGKF